MPLEVCTHSSPRALPTSCRLAETPPPSLVVSPVRYPSFVPSKFGEPIQKAEKIGWEGRAPFHTILLLRTPRPTTSRFRYVHAASTMLEFGGSDQFKIKFNKF
ncbi:hypothetical protein BRADI_2g18232v3 [Brachypodium distachyon]|uniref:Uncharacterized protein n=1 Tax=Brachypodium distachyon TaxID=15368 RepID=A0A2K2D933_BRADI|nr:hypothetical protein BRADI_2g18232v3 [Brachypodium distachyon]